MRKSAPNVRTTLLLASAAIAVPCLAHAQDRPGPAPDAQVSEIVVTAQRRQERLQDVPVSVTAVSADTLAKQKVQTASDLRSLVPNLQTVGTVGDATPIFSLRGVSMSDFSLNQSSPVATYFDEVYKGNFAILGVSLFDLDRVEVLRGPQGTLYGKNTTGGAVNLIAKKPTFDEQAELQLGGGDYNRFEASGFAQAPLGDKVAARLAFTYERADGWFKNLSPGQQDLDAVDEYGVRLSILAKPTDKAEFVLRLSTSDQTPTNYGILAQPGPAGIGAGLYGVFNGLDPVSNPRTDDFRTGLGKRELTSDFTPRRRNRTYAASLTSTIQLPGDLTLISVTSYDRGTLLVEEDTDGSALRTLSIPYRDAISQVTEDVRVSSSGRGRFNYTVGAFYGHERLFNSTQLQIYDDIDFTLDGRIDYQDCLAAGPPAGCYTRNSFHQTKDSGAVYADTSYAFDSRFKLHAGLRYSYDSGRQSDIKSEVFGVDGVPLINLIPGSETDLDATTTRSFSNGNLSGKIGLDYRLGGNLYYISYSRGYRASSFNGQAFFDSSELTIAKPETIDAGEAGFKLQLLQRRLQLDGAVFYYGYENQQYLNVNPDGTQDLLNLPRSHVAGGELELVARPIPSVTVMTGLGVLDTEIDEGIVQGVSVKGKQLPNAPHVSLSYAIDWKALRASWGDIDLHLDGNYVSAQDYDALNSPSVHESPYNLLGGEVSFQPTNRHLLFRLWAKNLTNQVYYTSRIPITQFGFDYNHLGAPRTFGGTVSYKF